jgi:hypothetical protein
MDYYSKYKKYKLKFLNLRNQIGGAVIWQYQLRPGAMAGDDPANWAYYTSEESQIIEEHGNGTFFLPSGFSITKINRDMGFQQGMFNKRNIKRREVNDMTMVRINDAYRFLKTIKMFPRILEQDPNNLNRLRSNLMDIFQTNGEVFMSLGWDFPDAHTSYYIVLYQEIIRLRKPLEEINHGDILTLMNRIFPIQTQQQIKEREAEDRERKEREEREKDKFMGDSLYSRL